MTFDNTPFLVNLYLSIKQTILSKSEWESDVIYYETRDLDKMKKHEFLSEVAYVIFNSGMKNRVIAKKWKAIETCFFGFETEEIYTDPINVRRRMSKVFNNEKKISAVIDAAMKIDKIGFDRLKSKIKDGGPDYLETFDYIGPVIKYHLAKNIGFDCVKPDRHLVRIAAVARYETPEQMCKAIQEATGDRLAVIDYVLWRYAASVDRNYLERFRVE